MPTTFEAAEHSFVMLLVEQTQDYTNHVIQNLRRRTRSQRLEQIQLPPHRYYAAEVLDAVAPILSTLDRLRWSHTFLKGFPNGQVYRDKGITRDAWMEYHYAYYAASYASVRDQVLLLTNQVLRLRLPERLCTMDGVLQNGWVRPTDVPAVVKEIAAAARHHQETRNRHLHRGKLPDIADLLEDELFRSLSIIGIMDLLQPDKLTAEHRAFVNQGFRGIVSELRGRMATETATLDKLLAKLLGSLEVHYRRKYDELKPIALADLQAQTHLDRARQRLQNRRIAPKDNASVADAPSSPLEAE